MRVVGQRYEFDDSVFATPGVVYDLGCWRWDWLPPFAGRKLVIGVDPQETTQPPGTVLIRRAIAPYGGTVAMHGKGLGAACADPALPYTIPSGYAAGRDELLPGTLSHVPAVTWRELLAAYGPPALVKLNIEGMELPLLMTLTHPIAPQVIVAFHSAATDAPQANWPPAGAVDGVLHYLSQYYAISETSIRHSGAEPWYIMTTEATKCE